MKSETIKYKCGCIATPEDFQITEKSKYHDVEYSIKIWKITTFCPEHTRNNRKKGDKFLHKIHKKTGRGYTKSPKELKDRK